MRAFVEGLAPNEQLIQEYLMTYEVKISRKLQSDSCFVGFLVNEGSDQTKKVVQIDAKELVQMKKVLGRFGQKKYSFLVLGSRGEIVKSNTVMYKVE